MGWMDRRIWFAEQRAEYRSFLSTPWLIQMDEQVMDGPLETPFHTLGVQWRAAASAFQLPYLTVEATKAYAESRDGLSEEECHHLSEKIWTEWMKIPQMGLSLVALMSQSYISFFFAYEYFLHSWYVAVFGVDHATNAKKTFHYNLTEYFPTIADAIWLGDGIKLKKDIRNAIAHNGGVVSGLDLGTTEIKVLDDVVPIAAWDVRELHETLRANVEILIGAFRAIPLPDLTRNSR